jgi:hypothetical protein
MSITKQPLYLVLIGLCVLLAFVVGRHVAFCQIDQGRVEHVCPDCGAEDNHEADALWWTCYRCNRIHMPHVGRKPRIMPGPSPQ